MQRIFTAVAVAIGLAFVGPLGVSAESAAGEEGFTVLQGEVQAVDLDRNMITVDEGYFDEPEQLHVTADTEIISDGQAIQLGNLKEGDAVLVSYRQQGGQKISRQIIRQKVLPEQQS